MSMANSVQISRENFHYKEYRRQTLFFLFVPQHLYRNENSCLCANTVQIYKENFYISAGHNILLSEYIFYEIFSQI